MSRGNLEDKGISQLEIVSTLRRAGGNEERSSKAMPRPKTAPGDLSKGSSGSSKKSSGNDTVPEKQQELYIAEEG
jgi:hypothetical protein